MDPMAWIDLFQTAPLAAAVVGLGWFVVRKDNQGKEREEAMRQIIVEQTTAAVQMSGALSSLTTAVTRLTDRLDL